MRVFIDTNVFVEYVERRLQYTYVRHIFNAIEDGEINGFLSQGSLYGITYAIEVGLKRMGIHNPEKREKVRHALNIILNISQIIGMSQEAFVRAVNNHDFNDIEDCYQYTCALENECDVLVTINIKDFKNADTSRVRIMTPEEFVRDCL